MLRVEAEACQFGGQCADMYCHELNITGAWVEAKGTEGLRFQAEGARDEHPQWLQSGVIELKVFHGCIEQGALYLNFHVKHLGRGGFAVGGLLGEDEHTEASMPSKACAHRTVL
ncbi:unnamed protein product [Prorocentrum cordatum]|uniref:Beta-galactosidase n=1 Tax=Prorocentrum cordatum TaxID=2364126 RepID=A0ABN9QUS7_9DINO|nr:unnamed protein product [Polarella glacialis]